MAQSTTAILAGQARVFIGTYSGVVLPVSGAPPTLFQHTAGVPSGLQTGFTDAGFTTGASTFEYKATKEEILAEQSLVAVDVFTKEEMAQVVFTAYERTYNTLKTAFDNVGTVSDASKDLYYAGNGTAILTPLILSVALSAVHRDNVAKYSVLCLYRCYSMEGVKLPFDKGKATSYQVTLKSLADVSRTAGDQMYQLFHEK